MPDDNQTAKSQNNWAQKGLGWLPDYPDLRDYQLDKEEIQKGGRINIEDASSDLEGLADNVIKALKLLQGEFGKGSAGTPDPFESLIQDLQNKVFGNISFLNVKLRKILRPSPQRIGKLLPSLLPTLNYQDDLSKQSLYELKTYLYIYFSTQPEDESSPNFYSRVLASVKIPNNVASNKTQAEVDKLKAEVNKLDQVNGTITWLKNTEFDDTTRFLVQVFQLHNDVETSGVVGALTYHTLSKTLCKKGEPDCSDYPWKHQLKSMSAFPKVQLISISSLIPSEVIESLFESLISVCAKRLEQERNKRNNVIDSLISKDFFNALEKIDFLKKITNVVGYYESNTLSDLTSVELDGNWKSVFRFLSCPLDLSTEEIKNHLSNSRLFLFTVRSSCPERKDCQSRREIFLQASYKVFTNEFKVIEPLISVILKLITPIGSAQYRNWAEAIATGLERFEVLSGSSRKLNDLNVTEYDRFLLAEALQKTCQELNEGLYLVGSEIDNFASSQKTLKEHLKTLRDREQEISETKKEKEGENQELSTDLKQELVALEQCIKSTNDQLSLIQSRRQEKEAILGATCYFYFLIWKFVEYYSQRLARFHRNLLDKYQVKFPLDQSEQESEEANLFDKRELFEIESPEQFYQGDFSLTDSEGASVNKDTTDCQLLPTERLQIPVLTNLSRLLGLNSLSPQTPTYFFLPGVVDLSFWCTPVEDQGSLKSCTAMAGIALMEYFVNRSLGKYTNLSPLFLYKVAQKQLNLTGDVGASLRETMKAMALHGVPPESVWEYDPAKVNEEPPPFCYSYAQNYQALKYFRLDYAGISSEALLLQIKAVLSAGFPAMFGFTIYTSAYEDGNAKQGWIPFPDAQRDKVKGGHAVVAVGYDDYKLMPRADRTGDTLGAFLIRNCWGKEWGKGGYGWLPYDYVRQGLTYDWWSLLKAEWFEQDLLGAGANTLSGGDKVIVRLSGGNKVIVRP